MVIMGGAVKFGFFLQTRAERLASLPSLPCSLVENRNGGCLFSCGLLQEKGFRVFGTDFWRLPPPRHDIIFAT